MRYKGKKSKQLKVKTNEEKYLKKCIRIKKNMKNNEKKTHR